MSLSGYDAGALADQVAKWSCYGESNGMGDSWDYTHDPILLAGWEVFPIILTPDYRSPQDPSTIYERVSSRLVEIRKGWRNET